MVRDLPDSGLRAGDLGTVVQVYSPNVLEGELVIAWGRTAALLTVSAGDMRPVRDDDLLAVRHTRSVRGAA